MRRTQGAAAATGPTAGLALSSIGSRDQSPLTGSGSHQGFDCPFTAAGCDDLRVAQVGDGGALGAAQDGVSRGLHYNKTKYRHLHDPRSLAARNNTRVPVTYARLILVQRHLLRLCEGTGEYLPSGFAENHLASCLPRAHAGGWCAFGAKDLG